MKIMDDKVWKIPQGTNNIEDSPEKILVKYANKLSEASANEFKGVVTDTIHEDTGAVTYTLYVVVPKLNDYMYKLIEVSLQNIIAFYPLKITFFARIKTDAYSCEDKDQFEKKLVELISSDVTSGILQYLKNIIEMKTTF